MSSLRFSRVPAIDTALKLVTVAVAMFAFVFVVMVPLYNVLCDALGINGKTAGEAYTAVPAAIDESREVTVQFVAINNDGMPWSFSPDTRMMRVNPGAVSRARRCRYSSLSIKICPRTFIPSHFRTHYSMSPAR